MNLATRCTACGTMFRVVQDQLKVSEGWVRCGRCEAVFHAQSHLFDLEHDTPPPWQPPAEDAAPDALDPVDADDPSASSDTPDAFDEAELHHASSPIEAEADDWAAPGAATSSWTDAPAVHDIDPPLAQDADHGLLPATADSLAAETDPSAPDLFPAMEDDAAADVTPEFLRQARRKERWQQPAVRGLLSVLALLATLLLAGQVVHHYRQLIAARHPNSLPWLEKFCAVASCRIGALQRITDVSIETTALTQVAEALPAPDDAASATPGNEAHALRLGLTLRNRGEWPIAMPNVDLSLTGSDGELVARRSLSPADFGVTDLRLLPGQDTPLSLRLRVASGRVSGYTVEVFYP